MDGTLPRFASVSQPQGKIFLGHHEPKVALVPTVLVVGVTGEGMRMDVFQFRDPVIGD